MILSSKRMNDKEFRRMVAEAMDSLPDSIAERLLNVAVIVQDAPDEDIMEEMGLEDDLELLGLYQGQSLLDRSFSDTVVFPDEILLYKRAIEYHCSETGESVKKAVRDTIIHEIGHHFGFSEEELSEMGLE